MKAKDNIVVYCDDNGLRAKINVLNNGSERFQKLLDEFSTLGIFKIDSFDQLLQLAREGDSYIKEKISEQIEPPKMGMFRMKKIHAVELLDLPDFQLVNDLARSCEGHLHDGSNYSIDNGKVIVKPESLERIKDGYSIIAQTPQTIKMIAAHKKAAEALEELNACFKDAFGHPIMKRDTLIGKVFVFNGKEDYEINLNQYFYQENRRVFSTHK